MKKAIIFGAGITGLSAGWKLSEAGYRVKIIESLPYIGGMASTFRHKDYCLDYGPHKIFTVLDPVMEEIRGLFDDRPLLEITKKSRLRLRGKYLNYPLGIADVFSALGLITGARCAASYAVSLLSRCLRSTSEESYEDWVVARYGRTIYDLVLGPYARKIWGNPRELSKELAASRIASPSLMEMIRQIIFGRRGQSPVISAEKFYYPQGGVVEISERMANCIRSNQGEISLETVARRCEVVKGGQIGKIIYADGAEDLLNPSDVVINTIPLACLMDLLGAAISAGEREACRQLKTRKLILLYMALGKDRLMDDNWLFFPEGRYRFNRVFEQKAFNLAMVPQGRTVLCAEITCDDNDPLWKAPDREVIARMEPQFREAGLLEGGVLEYFTRRVASAYPVYAIGYRDHLNMALDALDRISNLYSVGRQGGFSYTGMADSMDIGFSTAKYILNHDGKDDGWPDCRKNFYNYVVVD
ncbi:MAG: NAD(P)-binding protein [Verrucomicrobiota bacterium]